MSAEAVTRCDLGRFEYDRARYCFTHGGFLHGGAPQAESWCDKSPQAIRGDRVVSRRVDGLRVTSIVRGDLTNAHAGPNEPSHFR